jgi:hypothetical protein
MYPGAKLRILYECFPMSMLGRNFVVYIIHLVDFYSYVCS